MIEVEVDILTGEMYTVRADVLQDAGLSSSPIVDIGQVFQERLKNIIKYKYLG